MGGHFLSQGMQVLGSPVPMQTTGNGLVISFDTTVSKVGQYLRIALAADNGLDDFHPCQAGDIADDIGQLDVHLGQGFLHAIDGFGLIADLHGTLTNQRSHRANIISRPKSASEQTMSHELPNTLTIQNVRFTTGDLAGRTRIDQIHLKASRIEKFE